MNPHLDYCGIIYGQPNNKSFCTKIECIHCNAILAVTDAIKEHIKLSCIKKWSLNFWVLEDGSGDSAPFQN